MKTHPTPALPRNAIMRAALAKLNECRAKCPGIGGDVDAMNLRSLIRRNDWSRTATDQAARTLEGLAKGLGIDARDEVAALRALPLFEGMSEMVTLLDSFDVRGNTGAQLSPVLAAKLKNVPVSVIERIRAFVLLAQVTA